MRRNLQTGEQSLLSFGNVHLTNARVLLAAQTGARGQSVALQLARVDGTAFTFVHKPLWLVLAILCALVSVPSYSSMGGGFSGIGLIVALGFLVAYLGSRRFEIRIAAGDIVLAVGFGGSKKAVPSVTAFLDQVDAAAWTARVIEARGELPVQRAAAV